MGAIDDARDAAHMGAILAAQLVSILSRLERLWLSVFCRRETIMPQCMPVLRDVPANPVDLSCKEGLSDRRSAEAKDVIGGAQVIEAEDDAAAERTADLSD